MCWGGEFFIVGTLSQHFLFLLLCNLTKHRKGQIWAKRRLIGLQEEKLYSSLYWVVDYSLRESFISGSVLK